MTRGAAYVLEALHTEGIDHVFLVPGGLIDPFLPELAADGRIRAVVAAQEGGAAYMADGYARASGRFGVCLAIGGPGITNAVTPLAAAFTDRVPLLLLTGEVPTSWEGRGGFQDASPAGLNDVEIVRPLTAYSVEIEDVHLVAHHLRAALAAMLSEPRRPAHLSIPLNLQTAEIPTPYARLPDALYAPRAIDADAARRFWDVVAPGDGRPGARRIAIYAGNGAEASGAERELARLAERYEIPVATTLKAKGLLPEDHRLSLGVFGYAGTRHAAEALLGEDVDVLVVLGSGLNQRDTMFWSTRLRPRQALVQVDIDPGSIGRSYPADLAVVGDVREVLRHWLRQRGPGAKWLEDTREDRRAWLERVRASGPRLYDAENATSDAVPLHPARVVRELRRASPRDTVALVDSGAHRAFAGHYWESYGPNAYLSATNLGPMGWAIPAGIGAKAARPDRPCVVITGDGCMLMHGMEVQTAARYGIPVVWVVMNNGALGNVYLRQRQAGPGAAALAELPVHDWARFARSLGVEGATVERPDELEPAFRKAIESETPWVVDVRCGREYATPVEPWARAKQEWMDD